MSKSLIKLIDSSLMPASIIIVGKLISLLISFNIYGIDWSLAEINNPLFTVRPIVPVEYLLQVSTTSDLILYLIMLTGFGVKLFFALFLHDTHIPPKMLAKLAENNLLGLVKSSFEIFHEVTVWVIFLWITQLIIITNTINGNTSAILATVTFIMSLGSSILLLKDVYREISLEKKELGKKHALV